MKRKKLSKIVALAASLTLAMSIGMAASAAGSPVPEDKVTTDAPGKEVLESSFDLNTEGGRKANELKNMSEADMEEAVKKILMESPDCKHVAEKVEVLYLRELILYDTESGEYVEPSNFPAGGINVTIKVPNVKAGDVVYILHWLDNGTCEVLQGTVVEGGVSVHLDSLSPVAVVKVMNAAGGTPELKVVDTKATSPKTGK